MCGLFIQRGIAVAPSKNMTESLYLSNIDRGNQGVGILFVHDDEHHVIKTQTKHLDTKTKQAALFDLQFADHFLIPKLKFVAGHTLASTGESKVVHPIMLNHFWMAHNGMLHPSELDEQRGFIPGLDSSTLLGNIVHHYNVSQSTVGQAIATAQSEIQGSAGCWLYDTRENRCYLWRNMSSVWYGMVNGSMIYSSAKIDGLMMLPEGIVYEILNNVSPMPVATFEPKTIY